MTIEQNSSERQYVDLSDKRTLDRILVACEVEITDENRDQLRRFARECQDITEKDQHTFAELVDFARPRLIPSEG